MLPSREEEGNLQGDFSLPHHPQEMPRIGEGPERILGWQEIPSPT